MRSIGWYGGFCQQTIDYNKIASDLKNSHFDALSIHLIHGKYGNTQWFYPWQWNGQRFNLDNDNPSWWAFFEDTCNILASAGIGLNLKFFAQYWRAGDNFSPVAKKQHPFTQNNKGFSWGDINQLYDSWNHIALPQGKYEWVQFGFGPQNPDPPVDQYTLTKPFMGIFIDHAQKIVVGVRKKNLKWNFQWEPFNEEYSLYDSNKKAIVNHNGGEGRIWRWMQYRWKQNGWVPPGASDYMDKNQGSTEIYGVDLSHWKGSSKYMNSIGFKNEIHGVGVASLEQGQYPNVLAECKHLLGFALPATMRFSTDGTHEGLTPSDGKAKIQKQIISQLVKANLSKQIVNDIDIKLPAWDWNDADWKGNWNRVFPLVAAL